MDDPSTKPLPARLRAVAEVITAGARVADVGTDHAQLLAWLHTTGRIAHGIGIDVRPGPLAQAQRTLATTGADPIELREGDGLRPLVPGEVDTVVLAGMGGARIERLLDASPTVVDRLTSLVLQPNTGWAGVRRFIARKGWVLAHESMVEDRGKFYVVLGVRPTPGPPPSWSEDDLVLGPRLLIARPTTFEAWLRHELARTDRALGRVTARRASDDPRVVELRTHAHRLRAALEPGRYTFEPPLGGGSML